MSEETTQVIRAEEREFIACRYGRSDSTGKAVVQWIAPATVFVTIELVGEGPEKSFRRTWDGEPDDAEKLQSALAGIEEQRSGRESDFSLQLFIKGDQIAALSWSAEKETSEMAGLRIMLERTGHLACAIGMACWRRGHAFGEGGAYSQAIETFRKGIALLGDCYRSPDMIDDTGMRVALAEAHEKKGEIEIARNLLERALKTRVDEYLKARSLGSGNEQWEK